MSSTKQLSLVESYRVETLPTFFLFTLTTFHLLSVPIFCPLLLYSSDISVYPLYSSNLTLLLPRLVPYLLVHPSQHSHIPLRNLPAQDSYITVPAPGFSPPSTIFPGAVVVCRLETFNPFMGYVDEMRGRWGLLFLRGKKFEVGIRSYFKGLGLEESEWEFQSLVLKKGKWECWTWCWVELIPGVLLDGCCALKKKLAYSRILGCIYGEVCTKLW